MDVVSPNRFLGLSTERFLGIAFGLITHALFGVTVWQLFIFLSTAPGTPSRWALWIDAGLALQFAATHSLWLLPPARKRLGTIISRYFYGLFYCLMTCSSLLLVIWQWRVSELIVWKTSGWASTFMWSGFIGSWVALLYSLSLTGFGYQTGYTEWVHWLAGKPLPKRDFVPKSAYFVLRHPVYLSFLGLLWFVPTMTLDHALLTGIWTIYVFIGSWLKDQRLAYYLGESYRQYAAEVPGYPGMFIGPLGKWKPPMESNSSPKAPTARAIELTPLQS